MPPRIPPTQLSMSFPDPEEPCDPGPPLDFADELPPVPPGKLLSAAQAELRQGRWTPKGTHCGCCGRRNKVDVRSITADIGWVLLHIYRECRTKPFYKPTVLKGVGSSSRYETIMKHHGVLVQTERPEGGGGRKDAWWRLTEKGVAWIEGRIRLPRKIQLSPGDHFMGYVDESDTITLEDALGEPFSLIDFLNEVPHGPGHARPTG